MNSGKSPSASGSKRKFHLALIVLLAACVLYTGLAAALLLRSGEYLPLDALIKKQKETGGIYGPAVLPRDFHYKQRLYELHKPGIVTLGSSRVLGFRQQDFAKPFINMAGMSDLDEVIELAETSFKTHAPEMVILGVDFWWFHPQSENHTITRNAADRGISLNDLFQPFNWLVTGHLTPSQAWNILRGRSPDIGITAITQQDGFDAAGAHYYTSTITGSRAPDDFQFARTMAKIKKGGNEYAPRDTFSELQLKKLSGLLSLLQGKKIHIVMLVPPIAERVYREMEKTQGYKYTAQLRARLATLAAERHIPFFDYHAGGPAGTQECEFVDARHGGNVVYQRMLLDMAVHDAALRGRLNLAAIGWNIEHFGGQASLRDDEVDFLGLNCTKPSVRKRL